MILPASIKPYWSDEESGIYIINADCREVLPRLEGVNLVLTDPPYPGMTGRVSEYQQSELGPLDLFACHQFVFWHAMGEFPLSFSAVHIWDKKTGTQSQYERIFERNGTSKQLRVFRHYLINSTVAASFTGDTYNEHPSQKPIKLIRALLDLTIANLAVDPYCGSGTTGVACKERGLPCVLIDVEEKYCAIARDRIMATPRSLFAEPTQPKAVQLEAFD